MRKILALAIGILLTCSSLVSAADVVTVSKRDTSDENYIFRIKGSNQRFLLLDVTDDKDSKFFIMGIDYYGQVAFNTSAGNKFAPDLSLNIGYKLNHAFITDGFVQSHTQKTYKLPQNVIEHIDFNHVWETEGTDKNGENRYKTTCGIALLSQEELIKHQDKIGWCDNLLNRKDSPNGNCWWLRTGRHNGEILVVYTAVTNSQTASWGVTDGKPFIRPVFYVDRDFFAEVPIDLETAGSEVKKLFKEYYTVGELKNIYAESDIYNCLGFEPRVKISENAFKINDAETVEAEVTVKNNNSTSESGVVLMTYYDKYSRAKRTDSMAVLLSPGEERVCNLKLIFPEPPSEGEYVKISFINMSSPFAQTTNSLKYYCE